MTINRRLKATKGIFVRESKMMKPNDVNNTNPPTIDVPGGGGASGECYLWYWVDLVGIYNPGASPDWPNLNRRYQCLWNGSSEWTWIGGDLGTVAPSFAGYRLSVFGSYTNPKVSIYFPAVTTFCEWIPGDPVGCPTIKTYPVSAPIAGQELSAAAVSI